MKKTKGFLIVESIIAFTIAMLGVMTLELVIVTGQHNKQVIEERTDQKLANHIFKNVDIDQVIIHDKSYRRKH